MMPIGLNAYPATKRVILFSPHPDDDVIPWGTFSKLIKQGHDVHVVYQTWEYSCWMTRP
jgi:glucosamine-6-phosphate deaminase